MAISCSDQLCEITPDKYLQQLQQTLPKGVIWELDDPARAFTQYWSAIAEEMASTNNLLCQVPPQLHPCQGDETLQRNALIWGYPVECIGYPETTARLCEWLSITWGACNPTSLGFLEQVIEFVGFDGITLSEHVCTRRDCNCSANDCDSIRLITKPSASVIVSVDLDAFNVSITNLNAGGCCFKACDSICEWRIPELECLLRRFLSAYVNIVYQEAV